MARKSSTFRVAFNFAFIDGSPLSGPGYYAVQLFGALLSIIKNERADIELIGFARDDARSHFTLEGRSALIGIRSPSARVGRVLWEQAYLPLMSRRHDIDLLFSPAFVSPVWGARLLCACIHDMYFAVIPELLDPRQQRYWRLMVPVTVRRCTRLLTVSDQTRQDLEAHIPLARGKTAVTRLASRLRADADGVSPEPQAPFALLVANLTRNKNVEMVVEGLRIVRDAGIPLRLVHIGADPDQRLRAAVATAGLEHAVTALGKVSDAVLVGYYRAAFAVVNASLYEGFGMPALEAQALGAPLVSSNAGALVEAAGGEGALFYDPDRPEALAAHLVALWQDPVLRMTLRRRGAANAAGYSWDATARGTLAVFDAMRSELPA